MKNLLTLILMTIVTIYSTSCGSANAVAPATQIPTPQQTSGGSSTPSCSVERFYAGTPVESADYLQFASRACLITTADDGTPPTDVLESYTLQFDHLVQLANLEGGSNTGSAFEWAFWVDFKLPNGRTFSLYQQYDKHQDIQGNRNPWISFTAPLRLPAGTVITIRRPSLPDDYCTMKGSYAGTRGCATGQKIELIGVIN